jgi:hypothetical protein
MRAMRVALSCAILLAGATSLRGARAADPAPEPAAPADPAAPPSIAAPAASSDGSSIAPSPALRFKITPVTGPLDDVKKKTLVLSGAVLLSVPVVGEVTWWRNEETERFHRTNEGWFGRETYAGGADKASHTVGGYIISRELAIAFERVGNSPARARALAAGLTSLAGLVVEAGDGFSVYGFAWQDAFANVVGASLASAISAAKAEDLVGLRYGLVHAGIPPADGRAAAYGSDYSREIFSADLKLAGLFHRLHASPGPARFLLLSVNYGSKGYRFSPVDRRERNIGLDVGLNVAEILTAAGVRETTWWGLPLLKFFSYYRLEYTAWGWRYDLNHRRWSGFGTGNRFDPGKVIYQ